MKVNVTLNGLPVYVTNHALFERLRERLEPFDEYDTMPEWEDVEAWLDKMADLLREAVPDEVDPVHRVRRLISNAFEPVDYFRNTRYDLRFVLKHDEKPNRGEPKGRWVVRTVERPYENRR